MFTVHTSENLTNSETNGEYLERCQSPSLACSVSNVCEHSLPLGLMKDPPILYSFPARTYSRIVVGTQRQVLLVKDHTQIQEHERLDLAAHMLGPSVTVVEFPQEDNRETSSHICRGEAETGCL
jgi:hypothetical protein